MKLFLVSAFALIVSAPVFAFDATFAAGGGFSFTKAETKDIEDTELDEEISANLNAGVRALFPFSEYWSFRTGLYLQEKSAKYSIDFMGAEGDATFRFIQGAIPLNVQYKLNEKYYSFAGYSADYVINDYCNIEGDVEKCFLQEEPKRIIHNAMIGLGVLANKTLDIEFQYQHGLSEIYDKIKIHALQLQMFYKF